MGQHAKLFAAIVGAIAVTSAAAAAVEKPKQFDDLLGFDESYVRTLGLDDIIPEVTIFGNDFDALNETTSVLEAFNPNEDDIAKRFINGNDDRYQYSDGNYPWASVGKIQWSNGVFCSGALIGPRHVLTAKHCFVSGQTGTFSPGHDNGDRFGNGAITNVLMSGFPGGNACGTKGDWAIMIVNRRLGDERGYFGAKTADRNKVDQPILTHVGYPGDRDSGRRPYRTNGNRVQGFRPWDCDQYGPFYTDTDVMGGQSGGPIWEVDGGAPYIWGALSVGISSGGDAWAGWATGDQLIAGINQMRRDYP